MDLKDFDDIRPYSDSETTSVIERLLSYPDFCRFAEKVVGSDSFASLKQQYKQFTSIQQFQSTAINPLLRHLIRTKTTSFQSEGIEDSLSDNGCLYMSNHRDIVIDVAMLDNILLEHQIRTVDIGIGDNLLIYPWIKDLVRLNRAFIVSRGGKGRELLLQSKHLSEYIHYSIACRHNSVWIAQREGRAKDSDDRTQESVLKMLAMGSDKPFAESLKELNIRPLTISYEYDPCDYLKAKEFQLKRDNPDYQKSQTDDLTNMATGISGFKGQLTYYCSENINPAIDHIASLTSNRNEQATLIAQYIDRQIHAHYAIYHINYIAYDMLRSCDEYANIYSEKEKDNFEDYIRQRLDKIDIPDKDEKCLREYLLKIYANPLINHLKTFKQTT